MTKVITEKQAREITGGRKPLVPVVYEQAVKALAECLTLDDAKQWDNKADALAAWAKIYRDGKVERQAKALKLMAYRKMGQLALELRPKRPKALGRGHGLPASPNRLLENNGFTRAAARAAVALAELAPEAVDRIADRPRPPTPIVAHNQVMLTKTLSGEQVCKRPGMTDSYSWFIRGFLGRCVEGAKRRDAREVANGMSNDERLRAKTIAQDIADWCDEFLQQCERKLK